MEQKPTANAKFDILSNKAVKSSLLRSIVNFQAKLNIKKAFEPFDNGK